MKQNPTDKELGKLANSVVMEGWFGRRAGPDDNTEPMGGMDIYNIYVDVRSSEDLVRDVNIIRDFAKRQGLQTRIGATIEKVFPHTKKTALAVPIALVGDEYILDEFLRRLGDLDHVFKQNKVMRMPRIYDY